MYKSVVNLICFIALFIISFEPTSSFAKDEDHPWYITPKDYKHARKALSSAKKQRWSEVVSKAKKAKDPLVSKVFTWMQYTSGSKKTTFPEISEFIVQNPNWPSQDLLWRRSEEALSVKTPATEVIDWFTEKKSWLGKITFKKPITSKGMQLLAEAQLEFKKDLKTDVAAAHDMLRQSWILGNFGKKEEKHFLENHKKILRKQDYIARIDRLLWDERAKSAERIMKYVDADHTKLFKARIGLMRSSYGVDKLINAVPQSLKSDQGLLFDRIKWRAKRKRSDGIAELLDYVPANPTQPERWWKYKSRQIQEYLQKKKYNKAYKLATFHGLTKGVAFAEAEWLSGWIALRFLNNPKAAYRHFYSLYQGVVTPISMARGAYWSGRAAEENKNIDIAQSWYFTASNHPTTFYGQLAARKLGKKILNIPSQPVTSMNDIYSYHKNELNKAAFILHNLDRPGTAKKFLKAAVGNATSLGEIALITQLGQEIGRPDYGIETSREVSKSGLILTKAHYPLLPIIKNPKTKKEVSKPEKALVHAIIMQESAFHHYARSRAGALGLMQLLPRTARSMAKKAKLRYRKANLRSKNPAYNVTLGSKYLERMIDNWEGSYILGIASYNAGPYNVKKWLKRNGDPRKLNDHEEIIDWVEKIPFAETRNYVQRVLENTQIYRYILGKDTRPLARTIEDLKR